MSTTLARNTAPTLLQLADFPERSVIAHSLSDLLQLLRGDPHVLQGIGGVFMAQLADSDEAGRDSDLMSDS